MVKAPIRLVFPRAAYNYVLNPSGETAGNFSAVSGATVSRVTTYQKYGLYSYEVTATASGRGIQLDLETLAASTHYLTARIRGSGQEFRFKLGSTTKTPILLEKIDDYWNLWGIPFTASEASAATSVQITRFGTAGSSVFYVDGVQAEPAVLGGYTTYIDGTQEGCKWLGAVHASRSFRSGESKAGGVVQDLYTEYGFFVEKIVGGGSATQENQVDSYAQLPGGELNNIKTNFREFSVIGWFLADTEEELHENQQRLELALDHKAYAQEQPTRLRFYGSKVQKEISAYYSRGLEGDLSAFYDRFSVEDDQWKFNEKFRERVALQFDSPDPFWYEVGESAALLDTNDTATFRMVAGRIGSTGQWDALGPPHASGTYIQVNALAEDDTYIYIGGNFQNFNNIAAADYIVRYNKATGVYSALDAGLSSIVEALAIAPNGDLYVGGSFENASGVAAADFLAVWAVGASAFAAVGTPLSGAASILTVSTLVFDKIGKLYIGGSFANWANIAAADNAVVWDGSAYAALGAGGITGASGYVLDLAVGPDNTIYLAGDFTAPYPYVMGFNGSTFIDLDSPLDGAARAIAIDNGGGLYVGGAFTDFLKYYNGAAWINIGNPNNTIYHLVFGPDNSLYAAGAFTEIGGITLTDRAARFNGYAWGHLSVDLPGTPIVNEILVSKYVDPVVVQNYSIYLGFDTAGTGAFAGLETVSNEGSAPAFPRLIFSRSGGTSATLQSIRNERTGLELLCDYSLLSGETITIDLYPKDREESSSFFGDVSIVLPNSNLSQWQLLPGDNTISAFVSEAGSPTVVGWLLWRDSYRSYN